MKNSRNSARLRLALAAALATAAATGCESASAPAQAAETAIDRAPVAAQAAIAATLDTAKSVEKGTVPHAAKSAEGSQQVIKRDVYDLHLRYPSAKAGQSGQVEVTVTPAAGWKMNEEFPTKLAVQAPAQVTVSKSTMRLADAAAFSDKELRFAVDYTPQKAGPAAFTADFKFAVCTDATCDPKKEQLAWTVAVE